MCASVCRLPVRRLSLVPLRMAALRRLWRCPNVRLSLAFVSDFFLLYVRLSGVARFGGMMKNVGSESPNRDTLWGLEVVDFWKSRMRNSQG